MNKNWLDRFAQVMGRFVPDAITACVILLVLLFATALVLGNSLSKTMEAYYQGLWMLLPFTMQMTLIITLSSVLASTPLFRKAVIALSRIPKTANQVVALGVFFPMAINTYAGVRQADPLLIRAAVSFGAGRLSIIRKVVLPSALPMVFAGLKLGAGIALLPGF